MKRLLMLIALFSALTGVVQAGPILGLIPANGIISGTPGSTVGWGFTLSNDLGFIVPSLVVFCEGAFNPGCTNTYGTFTDFAAQFQTNVVGTTVVQTFNNATHQGIGSFAINANAPAGAKDIGTIFLVYDTFTCDITNPSCNPVQTGFSQLLSASAEVDVTASAVPEPTTLSMTVLGAVALMIHAFLYGASKTVRFTTANTNIAISLVDNPTSVDDK
jgi:hypothetical protein